MAFWRIGNNFANTSPIDKLLDKQDHTLLDILDEADILQELLAPNTRLVEYLREPEIMQQLVKLVVDPGLSAPTQDPETKVSITKIDDEDSKQDSETRSKEKDAFDSTANDNDHDKPYHDDDDDDEHNHSYFDDEDSRERFAKIACEVLSSDVWSITEALMESPELIDEIWGILDYPTPLSMDHAGNFTKINEYLLDKKTDELLQYIKSQDAFVERFMRHIDNPPLMDFLLKVISSDKPDNSTGIIEFLQHQNLINSLIDFFAPEVPPPVQSAAGDFLKAFITISANSTSDNTTIGPNELSRELVSEPCIRRLVEYMLHGGSGLATSVGVVIEIIRKNNSDYDFVPVMYITIESHPPTSRDPIYLGTLVKIFTENIPKFQAMLVKPRDSVLKTPFGQIEPLGFERFKICELVAELLHCSNMALLNDASGEAIVRARDLERIRVRKQHFETHGGYPPLEYPHLLEELEKAQKELENISANEEDENSKMDISTEESEASAAPEESNASVKPENGSVAEDLGKLSLDQQEAQAGQAGNEETGEIPSEASLRENSVVGDKLKIALVDNQVITQILHMFFQFPWNNFLHNVVFDIVQQVLNGSMTEGFNRYLAIDMFQTGRLTYLICDGQKKCAEYQEKNKCRLGYMGHLTLISEEVVKFTAFHALNTISPTIADIFEDPEWIAYISETLTKIREQYNSILGGQRPEDSQMEMNPDAIILRNDEEPFELDDLSVQQQQQNDEDMKDEDDEFGRGEGNDSNEGHDKFSQYVSQQMTNGNQFGSSDEDDDDDEWDNEKAGFRTQAFDNTSHALASNEQSVPLGSGISQKVHLLGSAGSDEESGSANNSEEEGDEDDEDLGLVRSKSHNEMSWDAEEAQKIVDSIQQIRPQNASP